MTQPFHELLEPAVATHASLSSSNMSAIEKVVGASIAISLKRIADTLDKIAEAQTRQAFPAMQIEKTKIETAMAAHRDEHTS